MVEPSDGSVDRRPAGPLFRWGRRVLFVLLGLAVVWVVGINVWLATTAPSNLSRRPDKMQVHYERAWSIWPGRVHVRGLRLSAQTWRNQWQLDLAQGTLDISLTALLDRHFLLRSGRGQDVGFLLRRRATHEESPDASRLAAEGLPELEDHAWTRALDERPPPKAHRWRVTLNDVELRDLREIWFDRLRTVVETESESSVSGGLDVVMRGELALDDVRLQIGRARLLVGPEELARDLQVDTDLTLAPTASRKLREPETFAGLSGRIGIEAEVEDVGFLESLLPRQQRFELDAAGRLALDLGLDGGRVTPESTLHVQAERLGVDVGSVSGVGRGTLIGTVVADNDRSVGRLRAVIESVKVGAGQEELARAERLELELEGLDPRLGGGLKEPRVLLVLPAVRVPDLREFSNLLPRGVGIEIHGGSGVARTRIELSGSEERADFDLQAEDARLEFRGTPISGNLRLSGRTRGNPASGRLVLFEVETTFRGRTGAAPGTARQPVAFDLQLAEANLIVPREGKGLDRISNMRLAGDVLEITGTLDDLGWWESPVRGAKWLRLTGRGDLVAKLRLRGAGTSTRLAAPSSVRLDIPDLRATLGRWTARSSGRLVGDLGASGPRASRLSVEFARPMVEREGLPAIELPALSVRASGPRLAEGLALEDVRVELDAEATTLSDLTVLNPYLPEGRLEWARGAGTVKGSMELRGNQLDGDFILRSSERAEATVLGFPVQASVDLEASIRSAHAQQGRFTFQGSKLRLDDVLFVDLPDHAGAWWAIMEIGEGSARIEQPLQLDAQVELRMRDTEPIVQLVGESRRVVRWLSGLLEVQDVVGTARVILDADGVRFQDLAIIGDGLKIDGRIDLRDQVAALLLIELHGVRAGFELIGDWRDVNVLRPRRWFEERSAVWQTGARR